MYKGLGFGGKTGGGGKNPFGSRDRCPSWGLLPFLVSPLAPHVHAKYVGFHPHATPVASYVERRPGSHLAAANNRGGWGRGGPLASAFADVPSCSEFEQLGIVSGTDASTSPGALHNTPTPATWAQLLPSNPEVTHAASAISAITEQLNLPGTRARRAGGSAFVARREKKGSFCLGRLGGLTGFAQQSAAAAATGH